jgi:hypothetical protein
MRVALLLSWFGIVGLAGAVQAQPVERLRIGINGGGQLGSQTVSQDFTVIAYVEPASILNEIELSAGAMFDLGASYHLAGPWWAGVAFSSVSRSVDGAIDASIPHPFFFNRPRDVVGTADGLDSTERGIHVHLSYLIPLSNTLDIAVFGGPSRFTVKQDLVTDIAYDESYPFDAATFRSATVVSVSESAWGFNLGADVTWKLSSRFGVGGLVRFARGSTTLTADPGNEVSVDVGGTQVGGGVRIRF